MKRDSFSSTDLQKLNRQIEAWRTRQTGRVRLPSDFWAAAAALAKVHGVCQVSRTLRVDYYGLRRRTTGHAFGQTKAITSGAGGNAPEFLELKLEPLPGRSEGMSVGVVELWNGVQGVRLQTGDRPDVWLALAQSFWRLRE